jgi:signal transduction histidine kinase/CheY-like chemotaxis protein/sugar lactone lactonase YvrE
MPPRWRWLLLCAGLWLAAPLWAAVPATPQPRQFSVLDGLPSNSVNDIAEDRQGYLWIATRDGLARYDGVGFRIWRVGSGLRDNFIWSVHVDAHDRVWIGTQQAGLAVLDADRRSFRHYDRRSHPQIGSNAVWSIETTPDGALWFGTSDGGLHRLETSGRITRFMPGPDPGDLPATGVSVLRPDARAGSRGGLWVATTGGVARWNGRGFDRVPLLDGGGRVDSLSVGTDGRLWMGVAGGGQVRGPDGRVARIPYRDPVLDGPALQVLLHDRQGARWLDTRSGLAREWRGQVRNVLLYSNTSRGVVRPAWSGAYEDREGGLWFASTDSGLWHLPANWREFSLLTRRVDDPTTPANAFVHGVAPARGGGLWLVGSGGVLDRLDPANGRVTHEERAICNSNPGASVHEAADGAVWVGCRGQLVRLDLDGTLRRWRSNDARDAAPPDVTKRIAELSDGTLWFSDLSSVQVRAPDGRLLDQVRSGDGRGLSAGILVRQLARAPDGGLWMASSHGLSSWNAGARRFEPVPGAPRQSLAGFAVDASGKVWLAGMGSLSSWRWDGATLSPLRTLDADDGIPAVLPSGIVVDGAGMLWMTSVRGLVRYDPQRRRVRIHGVRDGLPSQEFSDSPLHLSPLGYIAVGTADGLLLFQPQQVAWGGGAPTLAIASVRVRRGDARVDMPRSGQVALRPGDRDLEVAARLLSFTNAHAHRYRFWLHGYDPGWVELDAGGERLFASLEPGRYRLDVQARTADGEWSATQSLHLHMPPPWWRTPWAYTASALVLLSLLVWGGYAYRMRLKRRHAWQLAKQKQSLAEQASEAKTRFLATLGHEVRTPMTGVLGMSELLLAGDLDSGQRSQVEAIRGAGKHLLRLVNDALDLARIEAGKLQLENGRFRVRPLVQDVASLMAPLAERSGLQFRHAVDADVPHALQGDRTRVAQILMNLLGNAIKFTAHGFVSLEAMPLTGGGVRFAVSDSGPGLNAEQQQRLFRRFEQAEGARTAARYGGSGLGLAISQELAAAMGGRIDVDSAPGKGTRFTVDLPLPPDDVADAAPVPGNASAQPAVSPRRALRLLLVEDDATVAAVLVGLLQAQGHEVTHAAHGLSALAALATPADAQFDAALLDLDLPGMDGFALARQLRAQGFSAPLLAVTARADADAEPQAVEAGFDRFLRKPVTGAMLASALESIAASAARFD